MYLHTNILKYLVNIFLLLIYFNRFFLLLKHPKVVGCILEYILWVRNYFNHLSSNKYVYVLLWIMFSARRHAMDNNSWAFAGFMCKYRTLRTLTGISRFFISVYCSYTFGLLSSTSTFLNSFSCKWMSGRSEWLYMREKRERVVCLTSELVVLGTYCRRVIL